jgi:hypothetical protein
MRLTVSLNKMNNFIIIVKLDIYSDMAVLFKNSFISQI